MTRPAVGENPYAWDRVNTKLFVGREELVNEFVHAVQACHSSAIVGGRKMGKTTLLRRLELELRNFAVKEGSVTISVYVDVLGLPHPLSPGIVYASILEGATSQLERLGQKGIALAAWRSALLDPACGESNRIFADAVAQLISRIATLGYFRLVVLIDEVEPISLAGWGEGFLRNWRHLLSNEPSLSGHLCAVFAGAKEMSSLATDIGSPLGNILEWHELRLFSQDATERLVHEPTNYRFSSSVANRVFSLSGGHPFLIQYLMHHLWDSPSSNAPQRLQQAVRLFLKNHSLHFYQWWFGKLDGKEREIYSALVLARHYVRRKELAVQFGESTTDRALRVLAHTGIVTRSPKAEMYKAAGTMFRDWWRRFGSTNVEPSGADRRILQELGRICPDMAAKYRTAWIIQSAELPNYSGAVSEIRDVLTLLLAKLAPDEEVVAARLRGKGVDTEGNQTHPTRRERVDFILRKKGDGDSSSLLVGMELLDTLIDQVGRAVSSGYSSASKHTHTHATQEQAWRCLKQLESVVAQLL